MNGPNPKLISVDEAAEQVGLPPRRLREIIKNGGLVVYRLTPRDVRIDPDDLRRWLESKREVAGAKPIATNVRPALPQAKPPARLAKIRLN